MSCHAGSTFVLQDSVAHGWRLCQSVLVTGLGGRHSSAPLPHFCDCCAAVRGAAAGRQVEVELGPLVGNVQQSSSSSIQPVVCGPPSSLPANDLHSLAVVFVGTRTNSVGADCTTLVLAAAHLHRRVVGRRLAQFTELLVCVVCVLCAANPALGSAGGLCKQYWQSCPPFPVRLCLACCAVGEVLACRVVLCPGAVSIAQSSFCCPASRQAGRLDGSCSMCNFPVSTSAVCCSAAHPLFLVFGF